MVKDKKASEFATRDYTIHLSKRLYGVTFKKRAPRAVREVKKFAQQMMKTRCVYLLLCVVCWDQRAGQHWLLAHRGMQMQDLTLCLFLYWWDVGGRCKARRVLVSDRRVLRERDHPILVGCTPHTEHAYQREDELGGKPMFLYRAEVTEKITPSSGWPFALVRSSFGVELNP